MLLLSTASLQSQITNPLPTVSGFDDPLSPNSKKSPLIEALSHLSKSDLESMERISRALKTTYGGPTQVTVDDLFGSHPAEPAQSPVTQLSQQRTLTNVPPTKRDDCHPS